MKPSENTWNLCTYCHKLELGNETRFKQKHAPCKIDPNPTLANRFLTLKHYIEEQLELQPGQIEINRTKNHIKMSFLFENPPKKQTAPSAVDEKNIR
ncbi:MAG: hypothetical protein J4215_04365 [Candidatus Diapherotrites archaeon]|uniref:Uncharacterized protein n=1 Tax=Candidatus Iainarchaeum sp. TaxID=3101447 RepID=A0A8T4L5B6_9ARCH|nr:hypothetical protein [Candidatus Diapherotrites archaeon]